MNRSRFVTAGVSIVVGALALVCTLCLGATSSGRKQAAQSAKDREQFVIFSGRTDGHYYLRFEPNPDNVHNVLYLLSTVCLAYGHDYPIFSYVDAKANVSDIQSALDLAGKAQCDNVRTFIVDWDKSQMQEIKFGVAEPVTKTPKPFAEMK
jgi:hypothetical protein